MLVLLLSLLPLLLGVSVAVFAVIAVAVAAIGFRCYCSCCISCRPFEPRSGIQIFCHPSFVAAASMASDSAVVFALALEHSQNHHCF